MLGARIRTLRLAHGWTQAQLAERVQVSATYISMLERGRAIHATSPVLGRLAAALDIAVSDLVDVNRPLATGLPGLPPARAAADVEFQRLIKVWPHIQPALRPYLVELASTLATMSMVLDSAADPNQGAPHNAAGAEATAQD